MVTVYDVPPDRLIKKLGEHLKKEKKLTVPEWALYVKTGIHREKPPVNDDWWFVRGAAVLRKIYIKGPIGSERLRAEFGGVRDRGSKPYRAVKGSGKIIRTLLQQLEEAGLVTAKERKGRMITPQGQSLLDRLSKEVFDEIAAENPELTKY
ncbi:MAG TPA: 30S ribosomal protein S19e [Thermoplasmata archaeon]|nr:30S ribosomal protein S19e [Thermoplasmata archaeon]